MRLSLRSAGVLVAASVVTLVFTPEAGHVRGPAPILAQEKPKLDKPKVQNPPVRRPTSPPIAPATDSGQEQSNEPAAAAKERRSASVFRLLRDHPLSSDTGRTAQIEAALEETVDFKIEPQSLRDALDLLAAKFRIPIVADKRTFGDADVNLLQEVKLNVQCLTLQDTLDLLLSSQTVPLSFEIRDRTLLISTVEQIKEDLQVVVYDCRDLALVGTLDHFAIEKQDGGSGASGGTWGGGGGTFQAFPEATQPASAAQSVPQKGAAAAPSPVQPPAAAAPAKLAPPAAAPAPAPAVAPYPRAPAAPRLPLVRTIMAAVDPDSWEEGATITEFGGLLVVRQNPINHDKIKTLLADIRRMRADGAFASFAKDYEAEAKRREAEDSHRSANSSNGALQPSPTGERKNAVGR
jgi:hypothetical protein